MKTAVQEEGGKEARQSLNASMIVAMHIAPMKETIIVDDCVRLKDLIIRMIADAESTYLSKTFVKIFQSHRRHQHGKRLTKKTHVSLHQ